MLQGVFPIGKRDGTAENIQQRRLASGRPDIDAQQVGCRKRLHPVSLSHRALPPARQSGGTKAPHASAYCRD